MPTSPPPPSGRQYRIESGPHRATLVEVGGGVREYEDGRGKVLAGFAEQDITPMGHGAILAPWPNRLAGGRYSFAGTSYQVAISEPASGNAIHGLSRWARWDALAQAADAVTLAYELPPQPGYPFFISLSVHWSVSADGLRAEHTATNLGPTPAPFGLGIHPYLDRGGVALPDVRLQLPAATYLTTDDRDIPTGTRPVEGSDYDFRAAHPLGPVRLNTCFAGLRRDGDGIATARAGDLELWVDAAFDYLQVYTPDALGVAIEPMTCAPDAFNSGAGLITLSPGQTWHGRWGVRRHA